MGTNSTNPEFPEGGLWTTGFGAVGATLAALEKQGATLDDLKRIRSNDAIAHRVVMASRGIAESIDEKLARRIMGDDFFGSSAWADLHGVTLSGRQMKTVSKFPWSEETLDSECPFYKGKSVSQTHFTFLGLPSFSGKPLTIAEWQSIHPSDSQPRFYRYSPNCWFEKENFAISSTLELRWYLALKEAVPNSASKRWENMLSLLPPEYEPASPVAEVTKVLLYRKKNGVYLNQNIYAACDDLDSDGRRVIVGLCLDDTVNVNDWRGDPLGDVGLSASRKSGV